MTETTDIDPAPTLDTTRVDLVRHCARAAPPISLQTLTTLCESLLGVPLQLEAQPWQFCTPRMLQNAVDEPLVAAVLRATTGALTTVVALELEPTLASCVIDRALGGRAEDIPPHTTKPLSETQKGVLAYVLAQVLAESEQTDWQLATVVTTGAALEAAMGDAGQMIWPLQVQLANRRGFARVWVPAEVADRLPQKRPRADKAARAEVTLSVLSGRAALSLKELRSVKIGDAITLDEAWPGRHLAVVSGGGGPRLWCTPDERGLIIETVEPTLDEETPEGGSMTQAASTDDLAALAELPVELTVEVARFRLPVGELAALSPGEVLLSGTVANTPVTLRAGERAVAKGELVEVEGQLAVRITQLAG